MTLQQPTIKRQGKDILDTLANVVCSAAKYGEEIRCPNNCDRCILNRKQEAYLTPEIMIELLKGSPVTVTISET